MNEQQVPGSIQQAAGGQMGQGGGQGQKCMEIVQGLVTSGASAEEIGNTLLQMYAQAQQQGMA